MMLREHFGRCSGLPVELKEKFIQLKDGKTTQAATNSKEYWEYSAAKLGMVDTGRGIMNTEKTQAAAEAMPPYGTAPGPKKEETAPVMLLCQTEESLARTKFAFNLVNQVQRVHLLPEERRGNKKTLKVGLPGLACKYCCEEGRLGRSRVFPAKKRALATKLEDMYEHLIRCSVCPEKTKEQLKQDLFQCREKQIDLTSEQELFEFVWARLRKGPGARPKPKPGKVQIN
jgi:hypothetical protein